MILTANTGWPGQLLCLAIALVLSTAIGFERQLRNRSAGLRTHTLVGIGAALFMVISKYGFDDVLLKDLVRLDPSRVAAQIVSGIGFIGAGLVFVRRNKVRGLTTAASIWLTASVGTAAGAGLVIPAVFVTLSHFLVVGLYPYLLARTKLVRRNEHLLRVRYEDGTGALRLILLACTEQGFAVEGFVTRAENPVFERIFSEGADRSGAQEQAIVEVELELTGTASTDAVMRRLSEITTVHGVALDDDTE